MVVDQNARTGCGSCLRVCPAGVFAFSNGKAYAASPQACRYCYRCVRSHAASAITVS